LVNTLTINYAIQYYLEENGDETYITSNKSDQFSTEMNGEIGENIVLSYQSFSQFNFESEGIDADVLSIVDFLGLYHEHTQKNLLHLKSPIIQEIEKKAIIFHIIRSKCTDCH